MFMHIFGLAHIFWAVPNRDPDLTEFPSGIARQAVRPAELMAFQPHLPVTSGRQTDVTGEHSRKIGGIMKAAVS